MGQSQEATSNKRNIYFLFSYLHRPSLKQKERPQVLWKREKHISLCKRGTTVSPLPSHTDCQHSQCNNSTL